MRNKARRMYEQVHGDQPSEMDVDHSKPIVKGGSNSASNLRIRSRSRNRAFPRTKRAGMK